MLFWWKTDAYKTDAHSAKDLFKHFGITTDVVVEAVKSLI